MASEAIIQSVDRIPDRLTKVCSCCKKPRDIEKDFGPDRGATDGLHSWCRRCSRLASHVHYHEGGGKEREAKYRARPEVKARAKERRKANAEEGREQQKKYARSPMGRLIRRRAKAAYDFRHAITDKQRATSSARLAMYDAEVARVRERDEKAAGAELRLEPPSGKPIGRPMLVRHPTVAGAGL